MPVHKSMKSFMACHLICMPLFWKSFIILLCKLIRIAFNDIFCNLLGIKRGDSISAAFVNARMDNFSMLRRKSVYNFIVKLSKSTNAVVTSILQSVYFVHGSHLLDE